MVDGISRRDFEDLRDTIKGELKKHDEKLSEIVNTLQTIAVQNQRISSLEEQQGAMWKKWDALTDPRDGTIAIIRNHQASCPRGQMKALWSIIIPMGMAILGLLSLVIEVSRKVHG